MSFFMWCGEAIASEQLSTEALSLQRNQQMTTIVQSYVVAQDDPER